jgi:hypothetical protein
MRNFLAIFACLVLLTFSTAQQEGAPEADAYITYSADRTWVSNLYANMCGRDRFDYSLLSAGLRHVAEVYDNLPTDHPDAAGLRIVETYNVASYDEGGNKTTLKVPFILIEAPREAILGISQDLHKDFLWQSLMYSVNCESYTLWLPSTDLLNTYIRILTAKGGRVAVDNRYFSLSLPNVEMLGMQ